MIHILLTVTLDEMEALRAKAGGLSPKEFLRRVVREIVAEEADLTGEPDADEDVFVPTAAEDGTPKPGWLNEDVRKANEALEGRYRKPNAESPITIEGGEELVECLDRILDATRRSLRWTQLIAMEIARHTPSPQAVTEEAALARFQRFTEDVDRVVTGEVEPG